MAILRNDKGDDALFVLRRKESGLFEVDNIEILATLTYLQMVFSLGFPVWYWKVNFCL